MDREEQEVDRAQEFWSEKVKEMEGNLAASEHRIVLCHKRELRHYVFVRKLERDIVARDEHLEDLSKQIEDLQNGADYLEMSSELSDAMDIIKRMKLLLDDAPVC